MGSDDDTIYRVQVGAFSNREYAQKLLEELKKSGYNGFIVQSKPSSPAAPSIAVGDKVMLTEQAVIYGTQRRFADFVYESPLFVRELSDNRAVVSLTADGEITGATDVNHLTKIK